MLLSPEEYECDHCVQESSSKRTLGRGSSKIGGNVDRFEMSGLC